MLNYLGWKEAAEMIDRGVRGAIESKRVTFDFVSQMVGATEVKCSEFGREIVENF